jgi:hypothetical protein
MPTHFGRGVLRLVMGHVGSPRVSLSAAISPGGRPFAGVVLKLASRDVPAARCGPRDLRADGGLCGSAPRHKCTRRPRSCASGGQAKGGTPSRQRRVSSLRKRNTGREGTASRELKPVSASRAQSFYATGPSHLGSLPLRHLHRLQVDQWAELGPLLLDRDQQFVEADVVHLAADIAS